MDMHVRHDAEYEFGMGWENGGFGGYRAAVVEGCLAPLAGIGDQLVSAATREHLDLGVRFHLKIVRKAIYVECIVGSRDCRPNGFYSLNPHPPMHREEHRLVIDYKMETQSVVDPYDDLWKFRVKNRARDAAMRLAADLARDGLPQHMRQAIAAIGLVKRFYSRLCSRHEWSERDLVHVE